MSQFRILKQKSISIIKISNIILKFLYKYIEEL